MRRSHLGGHLEYPADLLARCWEVGGNWRTLRKPKHTQVQPVNLSTDSNSSSGLNRGPWSCEVTTKPPCRPFGPDVKHIMCSLSSFSTRFRPVPFLSCAVFFKFSNIIWLNNKRCIGWYRLTFLNTTQRLAKEAVNNFTVPHYVFKKNHWDSL